MEVAYIGFCKIVSMPWNLDGIPSLTEVWNIDSANSTTPSIFDVPPVKTIPADIFSSNPFLDISALTKSKSSEYLGWIISARELLDNSLGGLPPTARTSTVSSSFVNSVTAQPFFCFISSACGVGVLKACAISLVTWSPAIGITPEKTIEPELKIAISVVPPPISTRQTPRSFSSSDKIECELASCSKTNPSTPNPQFLMHFSIFLIGYLIG